MQTEIDMGKGQIQPVSCISRGGEHTSMKKPNYLVVDDDACIRDFIDAVFANEAHITQACDGKELSNSFNSVSSI